MISILSTLVSLLSFRLRSRASLELELIGLRHQVIVLRRQRPRRLRLFLTDRLFEVWLCRVRPQILDTLVLVKPATVVGWHRKGFRIYWRRRSRGSGRSKTSAEIRDLIRRMSAANSLGRASHPWRIAQARRRYQPGHGWEVSATTPQDPLPDLAQFSAQPL